jgi:hypothetical protein
MCGNQNRFDVSILEDGTVSIKTQGFSAEVHKSADDLLDMVADMVGGVKETKKLPRVHLNVGANIGQNARQH